MNMPMSLRIRSLVALAGVALTAQSLSAQSLATYGSAEAAGYGTGSLYLGATVSAAGLGVTPYAAIGAQVFRYREGTGHGNGSAISPSVGLNYKTPTGMVGAGVGYAFASSGAIPVIGAPNSSSGVFTDVHANYWGDGSNSVEGIGSYNWRSEYYWTRLRATTRVADPIYAGVNLVYQGSNKSGYSHEYEIGPLVEYRVSPTFRVNGSIGYHGGDNNFPGTGYAQIGFLMLSDLSGMK